MTHDLHHLRLEYTACVKILRAERAMRQRVFGFADPDKTLRKTAEIDRILALLETLKDIAKEHLEPSQPALLDVPAKRQYP